MTKDVCVLLSHHGYCSITGTAKSRYKCTGKKDDCIYKSVGFIKAQIKRHLSSLSSMAAAKIASGYNQTATMLIVGKRGRGKSNTAGAIMESYAAKIATLVDGDPWDAHPEKYFTIDHVGIIDLQDIVRAIKILKEPESMYGGFVLDDVCALLGARDFMSKKSKLLNQILQTVRTKRVFVIITIPDNEGLDKDPRENSDFFVEMDVPDFDNEMAFGKAFIQDKKYRRGDIWHVYIKGIDKTTYVMHSFLSPSKAFSDIYEPKRAAMADKLFTENIGEVEKLISEIGEDGSCKKTGKAKQVTRGDLLYEPFRVLVEEKGMTSREAAEVLNWDRTEYFRLKKEHTKALDSTEDIV